MLVGFQKLPQSSYLGWDVERVSLLRIELCGVEDDSNLPLQHHEHHGVLVCAAHPLGAVTFNPENKLVLEQPRNLMI